MLQCVPFTSILDSAAGRIYRKVLCGILGFIWMVITPENPAYLISYITSQFVGNYFHKSLDLDWLKLEVLFCCQ